MHLGLKSVVYVTFTVILGFSSAVLTLPDCRPKILVGPIIALVVYGGFSLAVKYSWEAFLAGFVLIFFAVPWLIRSTIRFRARNSKFSNSRFFFQEPIKVPIGVLPSV